MQHTKRKVESGYLGIYLIMAMMLITSVVQMVYLKINMDRAYAIAEINAALIRDGFYYVLTSYQVDMTSFNFIYVGLAAALTAAIPAQAAKKRQNNKDEHTMKMITDLKDDHDLKSFVPQVMQAYLQTTIIS